MNGDNDAYRAWRWDREDAAAGRQRLTVQRAGHQVVVDHQGLAIDGQRIARTPLGPGDVHHADDPRTNRAFRVTDGGEVVYRGRIQARISPAPQPGLPGDLEIYGPHGPEWTPGRTAAEPVHRHDDDLEIA